MEHAIQQEFDRKTYKGITPRMWHSRDVHEVAPDVVRIPSVMVNMYLVGEEGARSGEWVLIDAGMKISERAILEVVQRRYGPESRPAAILLTHGHFDNVGALPALAKTWDVPVYAHPQEFPYLTGRAAYPPPDPTVGGGMIARSSMIYPRGPVDISPWLRPLPEDGSVPYLQGWRWIHTPGHTPGHVSFFRDQDRLLLAGDAFVTVKQESAMAVLIQYPKVHRPPAYYTTDWRAARDSVRKLLGLEPQVAATGHGVPMSGQRLQEELQSLFQGFSKAMPKHGRYVEHPARADESGVIYVPPKRRSWGQIALPLLGATAFLVGLGWINKSG